MVFIDLSGSKPPKIHKKSMRKRIRKKHRKKSSQKSILVSQNLQKSLQNHEKSFAERCKTKPFSRRYGNRAEIVAKQRASAFVKRPYG